MARSPGQNGRHGAARPETQIVLLIAVAASSLLAWIWGVDAEDGVFAARYNLLKLRRLVGQYRDEHHGRPPADLNDLLQSSNVQGVSSGSSQVSEVFPIGCYLYRMPENPVSEGGRTRRQSAKRISHDPAHDADITPNNEGGWLYNPQTGGVWIDHATLFRI